MNAKVINLPLTTVYESCIPIPAVTNNLVFIPNEVLENENLTLEALGVYCVLCSFNGTAALKELKSFNRKDSARTILKALNLLIKQGYVIAKQPEDDHQGRAIC